MEYNRKEQLFLDILIIKEGENIKTDTHQLDGQISFTNNEIFKVNANMNCKTKKKLTYCATFPQCKEY